MGHRIPFTGGIAVGLTDQEKAIESSSSSLRETKRQLRAHQAVTAHSFMFPSDFQLFTSATCTFHHPKQSDFCFHSSLT